MKVVLLDSGAPETCHPLTCTRTLGEIPVGNRPLASVVIERLRAAGFQPVEAGGAADCFVRGDAWISETALARLAGRGATGMKDRDGELLAWTGDASAAASASLPVDEDGFRIRYPWDLLRVNEMVLRDLSEGRIEGEISPAATVEGTLVLGRGSKILPGVYIEGTVVIGADCKIGPNCYLRGSTSIGDRCRIGQAVEIKNSIVMDGTSIGHLSYCGDSVVGTKVNFGAGTITANFRHDGNTHRSRVGESLRDTGRRKFGTIVGDGVHTGIHTSIYPGRKLWPRVCTLPGDVVNDDRRS
jgi:NDP-sugar pyrophosphorylase family protein